MEIKISNTDTAFSTVSSTLSAKHSNLDNLLNFGFVTSV